MAKGSKPQINWGDKGDDLLKIITKAVRAGRGPQAKKVVDKAAKQMRAQGKNKRANQLVRGFKDASGSMGTKSTKPRPTRPPSAPSIKGKSLPQNKAEERAATRQANFLLKRNEEPTTKAPMQKRQDPGVKARGSVVSTPKRSKSKPMGPSYEYEADSFRREVTADRRQMSSQPLRPADRKARAAKADANREKRHTEYVAKLDADIDNAKHPSTKAQARKRKADYMKKYNEKQKRIQQNRKGGKK